METTAKAKQIVVRFDPYSYGEIRAQAKTEHRGLGEFVRHAVLDYMEKIGSLNPNAGKGGEIL